MPKTPISFITNEEQIRRYDSVNLNPNLLRENQIWIYDADHSGRRLLHLAIDKMNINLVRNILDLGVSPNLTKIIPQESHKPIKPLAIVLKKISQTSSDSPELPILNSIMQVLIDYGADKSPIAHLAQEEELINKIVNRFGTSQAQIARNHMNLMNEKILNSILSSNEIILRNFYKGLKSLMHMTISSIQSLASGNVQSTDTSSDKFILTMLEYIPASGIFKSYLKDSYRERVLKDLKRQASFFTSNSHIDEVVDDYVVRMVQYYQADVLTPEIDVGFISQIAYSIDYLLDLPVRVAGVLRTLFSLEHPMQILSKDLPSADMEPHQNRVAIESIAKFIYFLKTFPLSYDTYLGIISARKMLPSASQINQFEVNEIENNVISSSLLKNIYLFGAISQLDYESTAIIKGTFAGWGFAENEIFVQQYAYFKSVVAFKQDTCVITFRGTKHDVNWISNISAFSSKLNIQNQEIYVHQGFLEAHASCWEGPDKLAQPGIKDIINSYKQNHPNANYYVTGHSLGGAMAHICALKLFDLDIDLSKINLYSFGEPRCLAVMKDKEAPVILREEKYFRVVNAYDPVCDLPFENGLGIFGAYRHSGTLIYFNENGQIAQYEAINIINKA
ncbi:MAG: lipase family protein, partial [Rickettsiaceae bacterium]|nr:lipase family protein [Rickettsiaceae bacterium]